MTDTQHTALQTGTHTTPLTGGDTEGKPLSTLTAGKQAGDGAKETGAVSEKALAILKRRW